MYFFPVHVAPSSPPHDSRATTTSSTSVTLAWYPPDPQEWNGEVVRYTVLYQLIGILGGIVNSTVGSVMSFSIPSSGQSLTNINDPVTVRLPLETETAVIEGLEEYSLYKFWVYFETSAGRSANSEWIQVETLSDGEILNSFTRSIHRVKLEAELYTKVPTST